MGTVGLVALVAMVLTVLAFVFANASSTRWVRHSREVMRLARTAMTAATDRQTGIRGYELTRDPAFLGPEMNARATLPMRLDSLVALTADNPEQHQRAQSLRAAVERWSREVAAPALAADLGTTGPSREVLRADKALFDPIRHAYADFIAAENALYGQRTKRVDRTQWAMVAAILLELAALALGLMRLARRAERQVRSLEEQQVQLEEQAVELEVKVEEAASLVDALSSANDQLTDAMERRTAAEAAARESDMTLEAVLEAAPIGIAIHDAAGRILRCNAALSAILGTNPHELTSRHEGAFAAVGLGELSSILDRVLATGTRVVNVELSSASGRDQRFWHVSCYPIRDEEGVMGAGSIVLETTERRQLEQQLLQSQKMDAVGQLAGGVAHDFNNLLTAILTYAQLLLETFEAGDGRRADLKEIIRSGQSAAALTRQLLTFSRQDVVHPSVVELNDLVFTAEHLLRRLLPANIELHVERSADDLEITVNGGQLEQALINLVVNARDAMPEGGALTIRTGRTVLETPRSEPASGELAPAGAYAVLTVSDTGYGMDAATQARIFEPFFTTKEVGKGTGLGLATTYGIVKQAGGHIWVDSEPYRGTSFKIHLPLTNVGSAAQEPAPSPEPGARDASETILLVDDNADVRTATRRVLQQHGYRVIDAGNGAEALDTLDAHLATVDLLITDIVMPELGGVELASEVSRRQPGVHVLFMSGYSRMSVERMHQFQDEAVFLEKPFTPGELTAKVRAVLAGA